MEKSLEFTFEEVAALLSLAHIAQMHPSDMQAAEALQMMYLVNTEQEYKEEFTTMALEHAVNGLSIAQNAIQKLQLLSSEGDTNAKH